VPVVELLIEHIGMRFTEATDARFTLIYISYPHFQTVLCDDSELNLK